MSAPTEENPINLNITTPPNPNREIYDTIVLDCSGSMGRIRASIITQINGYIKTLQDTATATGVKTYLSLFKFSDNVEEVFSFMDVREARPFTPADYEPDGMTALNDAVSTAVESMRTRLKGREASDDVDVTLTIYTDGDENNSKDYPKDNPNGTNKKIVALIGEIQDSYKWTITYVGAGEAETVEATAAAYGITSGNVTSYMHSHDGATASLRRMSDSRMTKSMAFADSGAKSNIGYFAGNVSQMTEAERQNMLGIKHTGGMNTHTAAGTSIPLVGIPGATTATIFPVDNVPESTDSAK